MKHENQTSHRLYVVAVAYWNPWWISIFACDAKRKYLAADVRFCCPYFDFYPRSKIFARNRSRVRGRTCFLHEPNRVDLFVSWSNSLDCTIGCGGGNFCTWCRIYCDLLVLGQQAIAWQYFARSRCSCHRNSMDREGVGRNQFALRGISLVESSPGSFG